MGDEFVAYFAGQLEKLSDEEFSAHIRRVQDAAADVKAEYMKKLDRREYRKAKLTAVFEVGDKDGDGTLSPEEAAVIGFVVNGGNWNEETTKHFMATVDKDENGRIELDEFLQYYELLIYGATDEQFARAEKVFEAVSEMGAIEKKLEKEVQREEAEDLAAHQAEEEAKRAVEMARTESQRKVAEEQLKAAEDKVAQADAELDETRKKEHLAEQARE